VNDFIRIMLPGFWIQFQSDRLCRHELPSG